jgi:hypothetical protein
MPLRNHFRPPTSVELPWPSLYSGWSCHIADVLVRAVPVSPDRYSVESALRPAVKTGVDVVSASDVEVGSEWRTAWQPPAPAVTTPITFADRWDTQVYRDSGGKQMVAAVAFVSPEESPVVFAQKVWAMLRDGVCVMVLDVVDGETLDAVCRIVGHSAGPPTDARRLGAGSFRPVTRTFTRDLDRTGQVDVWVERFGVGDTLPTMPLRLVADYFVPIELETIYTEVCRCRRVT